MADAKSAENWFARIRCSLEDDKLMLRRLSGTETLSQPFQFDLEMVSEDRGIDFAEVVGRPMRIELTPIAGGETRYFQGVVARFAQDDPEEGLAVYRARLVPWIWLLSRSTHCRVFPEQATHELLRSVFSFAPYASMELAGGMWTRPYIVQYRESDLDFASRLLEEEGFHYLFVHSESEGKLVTRPPEPASGSPVVNFDVGRDDPPPGLDLFRFTKEQEFSIGFYGASEFDYRDPAAPFAGQVATLLESGFESSLGQTDHPMEFVKTLGGSVDSAEALAKIRTMERDAAAIVFRGRSGSALVAPGELIEVTNHQAGYDGKFYVTSVTHQLEVAGGLSSARGGASSYENSFQCIPESVPYAPPRRTPRPVVQGSQTAIVIDDQDPDEMGRMLVRFPWSDDITLWVRVSQGWAGAGWGMQFHPRVGHEVIVEFLEGDPDQPIITGRVYNAQNEGPYRKNLKHGGVKSRSYGGGAEEYNEILIDDTPGEESLSLHAQKDFSITVENDKNESVTRDSSTTVERDQTVNVTRDFTMSGGRNGSASLGEKMTESVGTDKDVTIGANHTEAVSGDQTLSVGGSRSRSVTGAETIDAAADQTVSVGGAQNISVSGNRSISSGTNITDEAAANYTITAGAAFEANASTVKVSSSGSADFEGGATVKVTAGGGLELSAPTIKLSAGTIELNGLVKHN